MQELGGNMTPKSAGGVARIVVALRAQLIKFWQEHGSGFADMWRGVCVWMPCYPLC